MATKDLKKLTAIVKNDLSAVEDKVKEDTTPAKPVLPVASSGAFRAAVESNVKPATKSGAIDTLEALDPLGLKIQASTRMPGETHKPVTYKMDVRLIALLEILTRKQNQAAAISHLLVKGLAAVQQEMLASGSKNYHVSYESDDRNAFCGVEDEALLRLIAGIEAMTASTPTKE